MRRLPISGAALAEAVSVLRNGGLVVYPTETMYGFAVDATNPEAVTHLLSVKNRPAGKAISVLVKDQQMAEQFVELNEEAKNLYTTFLPGPLTVVSKSRGILDSRLDSELGNLGIRISSHPVAQALVNAFDGSLTATSANSAGAARPYSIEIMLNGLSERQKNLIDLVLDAGELPANEPSSVIDTTQQVQQLIRAGGHFLDITPPFHSDSELATQNYAADLTRSLIHLLPERPLVFALEGDLGAGKTQFAKGVATALGISQTVTSPTYTLMKEYEGTARLIHADLWRLTEVKPEELGLSEYLQPQTILVIEWSAPVNEFFKGRGYRVYMEPIAENERRISLAEL